MNARSDHERRADRAGDASAASAARLQAVHDRLTAAVADLTHGPAWQQLLQTAARLPQYSPTNQILIAAQAPQATAVGGYQFWRQLGRQVRKGEKGIAILAPVVHRATVDATHTALDQTTDGHPAGLGSTVATEQDPGPAGRRVVGFRVVHVWDISATDGPDVVEPPAPVLLSGQAPPGLYDGLAAQVREQGFQLLRHPLAVPHLGEGKANGVTDFFARTVVVDGRLSDRQAAKTACHELGHLLMHAPGSRPEGLTRARAEVEAESVAFVVTAAHGLDSHDYTVPYVTGWAGGDLTLVQRSAERVLSTAQAILARTPPPAGHAPHDGSGLTREPARDRQQAPTVRRESALADRPAGRFVPPSLDGGRRSATADRAHTRDLGRFR